VDIKIGAVCMYVVAVFWFPIRIFTNHPMLYISYLGTVNILIQ